MTIRVPGDSGRMFAYTDRNNGYLQLAGGAAATAEDGYFRGRQKYLSDFFLSPGPGMADLYRTNALYTDVSPEGFTVRFDPDGTGIDLRVSLLLDEQALYLACGPGCPDAGIGIVLARDHAWKKSVDGGIFIFESDTGACISSVSDFNLEQAGPDRIALFSGENGAALTLYLVFGNDRETVRAKAAALARDDAVDNHRAKVASFFGGSDSVSGKDEFDEAVRWARFSGWMLSTADSGPGIWAGLPWSRENRLRDAFIALPGILLANGRFPEARSLLLSAARRFGRESSAVRGGADVPLLFIRALWEYVRYSGDIPVLGLLGETVDGIIDGMLAAHTDTHGFLLHGDGDTWMDAVSRDCGAWTPRGNRACEVQAFWYTALRIGSRMARLASFPARAERLDALASGLRESFRKYFWSSSRNALADRLFPAAHGEGLADFRVRPNQLFAITAPSVLEGDDSDLLGKREQALLLENVKRELVSPFGLFTLCPDNPLFYPASACHDGRIWLWNTGAWISAAAACESAVFTGVSSALLLNVSRLVAASPCAGTLAETAGAESGSGEKPELAGNRSQASSVAEFVRNVHQDVIGFRPFLAENRIEIRPWLPDWTDSWNAECPFGNGWKLAVRLERSSDDDGIRCALVWIAENPPDRPPLPDLRANGMPLRPGRELLLYFPGNKPEKIRNAVVTGIRQDAFSERLPDAGWSGQLRHRGFLEKLLATGYLSRRSGAGEHAAVLESLFDSDWFAKKYDSDLPMGALWSREKTVFRVWAPTARSVSLVLFRNGADTASPVVLSMRERSGVWELPVSGDQNGTYYCFRVRVHGIVRDSADPYARACGVNGKRSMVIDFSTANPDGWENLAAPPLASPNDAVVYEVHVADITSSPSWNGDPGLRRTWSGAGRGGTAFAGIPTGFDHIRSLGVTHIQLMPVFDFSSVDERRLDDPAYGAQAAGGLFNWGYDPENWSAPEGSYSTNPFDGAVRVRELKSFIAQCLSSGIGVIMDVVYNHVPSAGDHPLGVCVPGYYFRLDSFSGAGDDTASERPMFRSFMIDSLRFWLSEYKLSGFRFDLMGLHDVETMNAIAGALREIKSDVLLYGEGWDMYRGGKTVAASMREARKLDRIGFFNDAFRCGIKGSVFDAPSGGFIHDGSRRESVKFGLAGAVYHPQVHNGLVEGTANPNPWSDFTATSVNYTEIHDNLTLYDKLALVENGMSGEYYARLQKTAIGLVLLAQGQPVLHAGMEFMRTKEIPADLLAANPGLADVCRTADGSRAFSHNSYNLCDRINGLDWARCSEKRELVDHVRRLVAVRKAHPLFRLRTGAEVASSLSFFDGLSDVPSVLGWRIDGMPSGDGWAGVCAIVNPSPEKAVCILPDSPHGGLWHLVTDGDFFMGGQGFAERGENKAGAISPGTAVPIAAKALYLYAEF